MKREFVINRNGRDYVLYAGLLDEAHQQGLRSIKTQLIQAPASENGQVAICAAEVTTERGTFTGIGDADPSNVSRMMATALIRMAETRAKARALRDAVNVGMVALEELGEGGPEGVGAGGAGGGVSAGAPSQVEGAQRPTWDGVKQGAPAGSAEAPAPPPAVPVAGPRAVGEADSHRGEAPPPDSSRIVAFPGTDAVPAGPTRGDRGDGAETRRPSGPAGRAGTVRPLPTRAAGEVAPLPPTQTQLETIAKLARSTGRTVSTEGLTRAAASELITRLSEERYGARRPAP